MIHVLSPDSTWIQWNACCTSTDKNQKKFEVSNFFWFLSVDVELCSSKKIQLVKAEKPPSKARCMFVSSEPFSSFILSSYADWHVSCSWSIKIGKQLLEQFIMFVDMIILQLGSLRNKRYCPDRGLHRLIKNAINTRKALAHGLTWWTRPCPCLP